MLLVTIAFKRSDWLAFHIDTDHIFVFKFAMVCLPGDASRTFCKEHLLRYKNDTGSQSYSPLSTSYFSRFIVISRAIAHRTLHFIPLYPQLSIPYGGYETPTEGNDQQK